MKKTINGKKTRDTFSKFRDRMLRDSRLNHVPQHILDRLTNSGNNKDQPEKTPRRRNTPVSGKILYLTLIFAFLSWALEAAIDFAFFYDKTYLELLITDVPKHEAYIRTVMFAVILGFGLMCSILTAGRDAAEKRTAHLNDVLKAIRNVNQMICHERDPEKLIYRTCNELTQTRGYYHSWLVLFDNRQRPVNWASSGLGKEFEAIIELFKTGGLTNCAQKALKTSDIVIMDAEKQCSDCPLANIYGSRKAFAKRLEHDGQVYGLLATSIPAQMSGDLEEQQLFTEVCEDIAFALAAIEQGREKAAAEARLLRNEELLNKMGEKARVGGWEVDLQTGKQHWTREVYRIHEVDFDYEPTMEKGIKFYAPEAIPMLREAISRAINEGKGFELELPFITASGRRLWVNAVCNAVIEQGAAVRLEGTFQDITERKRAQIQLKQAHDELERKVQHRTEELTVINEELQAEIAKRLDVEDELRRNRDNLENQVQYRTAELRDSNEKLQQEVIEREQIEQALRESEEKFYKAFHSSPNIMCITTLEGGKYIDINDNFERVLGFRRNEIIGRRFEEIKIYIDPQDRKNLVADVSERNYLTNREIRFKSKFGEVITCDVSAATIEVSGIKCIIKSITDISDRKEMEEAVRLSEQRHRIITNMISDYVYSGILNEEGWVQTEWIAGPVRSISGYTVSEIQAAEKGWYSIAFPEFEKLMEDSIKKLRKNQPCVIEYRIRTKTGGVKWLRDYINPVQNKQTGEVDKILGAVQDITAQKEAENRILESTQRLKLALEGGALGLWDWNVTTGEVIYDHRLKEITQRNIDVDNDRFEKLLSIIHPEDRKTFELKINNLLEGDQPYYEAEYRVNRSGKEWRWILDRGKAVERDSSGRPVRITGVLSDVTERKHYQQQMNELNRTLISKNEELQNFISITSHDLRSPLVNIKGFSGELKNCWSDMKKIFEKQNDPETLKRELEKIIDGDISECLGFIQNGVDKMDQLLAGLTKLSRVGRVELNIESLDMNSLVKGIVSTMQYEIENINAKVIVNDLPPCMGDFNQINQAMSNLLSNSLKYTSNDRQPEITISGWLEGDKAFYTVQDNGIGICEQYLDKVFEIFHRLNPQGSTKGEGLGLSIVKRIIDRHGGEVSVQSEHGRGSIFYLCLKKG